MRVTFLTVMPSPYMMDLFDAMSRDPRFHLKVVFLEKPAVAAPGVYWDEKPLPAYASVLPGGWFFFSRARVHINSGLFAALDKDRPEVVVVMGYSGITCQLAMYRLWLKRVPWVFWGEVPGLERRGAMGGLLRWLAQRPMAWFSAGIAGIGSRAATAYRKVAKRGCPVWNIPYYCRTDAFLRITRTQEVVAQPHFLYCGQMVARKGVDLLVKAFCRLAQEHENIRLTLVGEGPMRASLAASVPEAVRQRVAWAGFKEIEDLPPYFAQANVFVLPSVHDGWGVVINQAISAGMAVIASDTVGAAIDLVKSNRSGLLIPANDEAALTAALQFFAHHPERIAAFGQAARERAWHLRPEQGAERWHQFCQAILQRKSNASQAWPAFAN